MPYLDERRSARSQVHHVPRTPKLRAPSEGGTLNYLMTDTSLRHAPHWPAEVLLQKAPGPCPATESSRS